MKTRVTICWPGMSGYLAAWLRAISARPEVEVTAVVAKLDGYFKGPLLDGLNVQTVPFEDLEHVNRMSKVIGATRPDVVTMSGWAFAGLRGLPFCSDFARTKFAMTIDTPFLGTWRQRLGRYRYPKYFARIDKVMVPGERGYQMGKALGFSDRQIHRGILAIDFNHFSGLWEQRVALPGGWPKKWLFIARYIPVKAIDVLMEAYTQYRSEVADAWPLSTMGAGEMAPLIHATPGVTDLGFVQPGDQPAVMIEHGAFILSSRYDAWGLAIAEACAAGLPVICTAICGACVELVRDYHNGLVCATDDARSMARSMVWFHRHADRLPAMGARGIELASAFTPELWAERMVNMIQDMT